MNYKITILIFLLFVGCKPTDNQIKYSAAVNYSNSGFTLIFDENLFKKIKKLKLSKRKEYEITDIIKIYKKEKNLNFYDLGRGSVWYDLGNFDNLNNCSNLVSIFQKRNNLEIGSIIEILGK